jgi:hypothetical protein
MDGASWFEHRLKPADSFDAIFVCVRAIAAFRFGGTRREAFYVEPYGVVATLDPDIDVASNIVIEESFGVNAGLWKRARVGLEVEFPEGATELSRALLAERKWRPQGAHAGRAAGLLTPR